MYLLCCIQSCITYIMEKAPLGSPPLLWQWFCCSSGPSDWGARGAIAPLQILAEIDAKPFPSNAFIYMIALQIFKPSYDPEDAPDHDCALKCLRVPYWFHRSLESHRDQSFIRVPKSFFNKKSSSLNWLLNQLKMGSNFSLAENIFLPIYQSLCLLKNKRWPGELNI